MTFWKDKSGLKVQAAEPTIVETMLGQMNLLESQKRTMSYDNRMNALEETKKLRGKMIEELGVDPDPKKVITAGSWTLD